MENATKRSTSGPAWKHMTMEKSWCCILLNFYIQLTANCLYEHDDTQRCDVAYTEWRWRPRGSVRLIDEVPSRMRSCSRLQAAVRHRGPQRSTPAADPRYTKRHWYHWCLQLGHHWPARATSTSSNIFQLTLKPHKFCNRQLNLQDGSQF